MQPTPLVLPGKSHGQRSLEAYSPWGHKSQTQLSMHAQTPKTILTDSNNINTVREKKWFRMGNTCIPVADSF